ncbi:peptide chain release factor 1-like, mitochondrial isoform X2 [Artemia franciscana]|uniref:Prokaryotic-type class I peptide chain release factors domain-containing protein n=2 Tax=Artemia franciscana TaxID=6661 RepID=A0AA88I632_ARTSF|nr:hypothetical protein QYM36_001336 [Artemia franciscana]
MITFQILTTLGRNNNLLFNIGRIPLVLSSRSASTTFDRRLFRVLEKRLHDCDGATKRRIDNLMSMWTKYEEDEKELQSMEDDVDFAELVTEEKDKLFEKFRILHTEALDVLVPEDVVERSDTILEVSAGVGGQEAMLFAGELFHMYSLFAESRQWKFEVASYDATEIGGIRKASASITGTSVFKYLRYEGGIHRVQRVPKTESKGRVHTSTAATIVLPQPTELVVEIHPKDLKIETKRASGAGGQHVNTTDSAVRIVHLPTGIAVECQSQRSQLQNKETAMKTLRAKIYQRQLDEQLVKSSRARKLQVSSNSRSDKIRTYNFNQDRVTDHRIGLTVRNIEEFMQGGYPFSQMIETLVKEGRNEIIEELYSTYE